METNQKSGTEQESTSEESVAVKKNHILAIFGAVIMISFFVFAAQAMIANGGNSQNNNYGAITADSVGSARNTAVPAAPLQGGKQTVELSMKDGNYYPNTIRLKKGVPAVINVDTDSVRGCYRGIQIPAFGVRKVVSENDNMIEFTPDKAGTFGFSCYMGMGRGQIIVEDETGSIPANVNTVTQDIPKGGSCGAGGGGCGCGG